MQNNNTKARDYGQVGYDTYYALIISTEPLEVGAPVIGWCHYLEEDENPEEFAAQTYNLEAVIDAGDHIYLVSQNIFDDEAADYKKEFGNTLIYFNAAKVVRELNTELIFDAQLKQKLIQKITRSD